MTGRVEPGALLRLAVALGRAADRSAQLALALVCALTWAAFILFAALLLGWDARWAAPSAAIVALVIELRSGAKSRSAPVSSRPQAPVWELAAAAGACLALAVATAKQLAAPLWSWDHFAMWGLQARVLLDAGQFDTARAMGREVGTLRHELGLSLFWWLGTAGRDLAEPVVRAMHLAFTWILFGLARAGCTRWSGDRSLGWLLAGLLALSPLFWDTVFVGVADLPLALWVFAALCIATDSAGEERSLRAGALLGFLPWIKNEGAVLAVLLGLALSFAPGLLTAPRRGRALARLWGAGLLVGGAGILIPSRVLPPWPSILRGDGWQRAAERAPDLQRFAGEALAQLGAVEWLGLWFALPAAMALGALGGRRLPVVVGGAVAAQLCFYLAVIFVADPDPFDQLNAAMTRIAGALLPLLLASMSGALAGLNSERRSRPGRPTPSG